MCSGDPGSGRSYFLLIIASAADSAAFATKLLTLRRSISAARLMSLRSSSVKYTKVFLPNFGVDLRRDATDLFFVTQQMVSPNYARLFETTFTIVLGMKRLQINE